MSITTATIDKRRREASQAELDAAEAGRLSDTLGDIRDDIARLEKRRDKFAELGAAHVEIPRSYYHPGMRVEFALEPDRSLLTGNQLAAKVEANIPALRETAKRTEQEIKRLVG